MFLASLLACTPPDADDDTGAPSAPEVRPWTVAIFMNGDNDLEEYVVHDLNELEAGDAGANAYVVVQADRIDGYDASDGDWTGARRYAVAHDDDDGTVTSPVVADLGEVDMGDPAVLAAVLTKANFDPAHLLALAADPEVKQALVATTEEAVARGVFGAPSIFVGEEMHFGQDRLEFVAAALRA